MRFLVTYSDLNSQPSLFPICTFETRADTVVVFFLTRALFLPPPSPSPILSVETRLRGFLSLLPKIVTETCHNFLLIELSCCSFGMK